MTGEPEAPVDLANAVELLLAHLDGDLDTCHAILTHANHTELALQLWWLCTQLAQQLEIDDELRDELRRAINDPGEATP